MRASCPSTKAGRQRAPEAAAMAAWDVTQGSVHKSAPCLIAPSSAALMLESSSDPDSSPETKSSTCHRLSDQRHKSLSGAMQRV